MQQAQGDIAIDDNATPDRRFNVLDVYVVGPAKSIFNNHATQIRVIGGAGLAQSQPKSGLW
ncbi:MAG: hypothetical protein NVSMB6_26910 [Burkholderiaceae bacterium]